MPLQLVRDKSERAEHIFLLYSKKSIKKRGHGMEVAIAASTSSHTSTDKESVCEEGS